MSDKQLTTYLLLLILSLFFFFDAALGQTCPPGTFVWYGDCESCTYGSYSSTWDATFCTWCPAGSCSSGLGASSCTLCPVGTYSFDEGFVDCWTCDAGTFAPQEGSTACTNCPAGSFSSDLGASSCTLCPVGKYSDHVGSIECYDCPVGTFAPQPGSTVCTLCPPGTYNLAAGSTSCDGQCPAGQTNNPSQRLLDCVVCGLGTYSPTPGSACLTCPAGTFASTSGSISCVACDPGYVSGPGAQSCTQCAGGTYASADKTTCVACPAGYVSSPGSSSPASCQACPATTYAAAATCKSCYPGGGSVAKSTSCTYPSNSTFSGAFGLTPNRVDLALRNNNNQVFQLLITNGVSSNGANLLGSPKTGTSTVISSGTICFFMTATDGSIQWKRWGGQWIDWTSIGTVSDFAPAAVYGYASGRVDLFVVSDNGKLFRKYISNVQGNGWQPTNGPTSWEQLAVPPVPLITAPTACSWGVNRLDVFAVGADLAVWHIWSDGTWRAWESMGGIATTAPTCSAYKRLTNNNHLDLYVRGLDSRLFVKSWDTQAGWTNWVGLSKTFTATSAAAVVVNTASSPNTYVFARGTDLKLYNLTTSFNGNTPTLSWGAWELTGPTQTWTSL